MNKVTSAIGKNGLAQVRDKLLHYRSVVKSLESQKANPSVAPNYFKALGIVQALEAVHDLGTGGSLAMRLL
jgi:hypothetical protein